MRFAHASGDFEPHTMNAPRSESPGSCPDAEALRRWARTGVPDPTTDSVTAHLDSCAECRGRFEAALGAERPDVGATAETSSLSPTLRRLLERLRAAGPEWRARARGDGFRDDGILGPPTAPDALGSFAGYQILERIAVGGMGVVYRARDEHLQRPVALKVLAPALAAHEGARDRFLREARAAAAVVHEGVVTIHAVGEESGLPYLVMELVAGRTLEARLREGPAELPELLRIGAQIGRGLAAAHARGLVHRDVKPANVLLEHDTARVKLTDFGLARAADDPGLTRVGIVAGTPEYMSPEQARGERLDARSDLFSLGAVLYVLATGRSPFRADSVAATLKRVCDHRPERVDRLRPALPRWFGEIVDCLLAARPERRFSSAEEVAALLEERRQHGERSSNPRPGTDSGSGGNQAPLDSVHRGRPALRMAAGILLVALIAAAVWMARHAPALTPKPSPGQRFALLRTNGTVAGFADLAGAVAAAGSGATIELAFDGAEECSPMAVQGKALRLRARPPFHPTLVVRTNDQPLLATDAPLALEGIEFRSPGPGSDLRALVPELQSPSSAVSRWVTDAMFARMDAGTASPALIDVRGAELEARHCRFVTRAGEGRPWDAVVLVHPRRALIADSEFYDLGGFAVRVRVIPRERDGAEAVPAVEITNCLFFASQPVFVGGTPGVRARVRLSRSTLVGLRLCNLRPSVAVDLEAIDCVIAMRRLFVFGPADNVPPGSTWVERGNWFASSAGDAGNETTHRAGPPSRDVPLDFARRIRESGRTGPLTAADFRADAVDEPPGPGCAADRVGPFGR